MLPDRDTHPAAQAVQIELLRKAGTARRGHLALSLSASVISMSRRPSRAREHSTTGAPLATLVR